MKGSIPTVPLKMSFALPDWVAPFLADQPPAATDDDRMRLAVELSRLNVERGTGGPFGAVVFAKGAPYPVSVGLNSVVRLNNSALHAEVTALMLAEKALQTFTLNLPTLPVHEIYTSCEPCAMCLGAILWSGVRKVACGAGRDAAHGIGFDEGPVFPESYKYLESKGIEVQFGVLGAEAAAVFDLYKKLSGLVYNG